MGRVMVFGVFDGVHEGHRAFLRQAREEGEYVIVVVTRDEVVEQLKEKRPKKDEKKRIQELTETGLVDEVVLGDAVLGTWSVIEKHKPDVIALGYDQEKLKKALRDFFASRSLGISVRVMKAFRPEQYHSSVIHENESQIPKSKRQIKSEI